MCYCLMSGKLITRLETAWEIALELLSYKQPRK